MESRRLNPLLGRLQPYPFEKLRALHAGVTPAPGFSPINLSIGEPKHPTPAFVRETLAGALDGLAAYPATAGTPALREAIAAWLMRRYALPALDAATQVLPVNGSREALFAFAQTVIDPAGGAARVACPNPFYQIYEGAALLAGAQPVFLNDGMPFDALDWRGVQLAYVCSPGNPTGRVLKLEDWRRLFELAERHGFVIAADECYSELYYDETCPPLGALQAAQQLGRGRYERVVVFSSLSKRSNAPGMRSGFVAGDAEILKKFLLYRTYHGSAMSLPVQQASIAAWGDEAHVRANRALYAEKYRSVLPLIGAPLATAMPEGGFYLWVRTPGDDTAFARELLRQYNVTVLPGSFLARDAHGANPGRHHVRVALVAPLAECVEAAQRIGRLARSL
ncbi:MAG TPA: succinyldiaminopimelate transaminase [Burkholderiales bacterium]